MPKKQAEGPKPKTMYTLVLDALRADQLQQWCLDRGWESFTVQYAQFAFRGNDVNVVFYTKSVLFTSMLLCVILLYII